MAGLFFSSNNCIKNGCYTLEEGQSYGQKDIPKPLFTGSVIKWYQVKMTLEEKAMLNLLTYPEYIEWQNTLMERASAASEGKTFWSNDTEVRQNVSQDEYSAFLSANNIDVSNNASVNFDTLYNQVANEAQASPEVTAPEASVSAPEPSVEDILANINSANSGGAERCLTQEEIEALFAAATAG